MQQKKSTLSSYKNESVDFLLDYFIYTPEYDEKPPSTGTTIPVTKPLIS